jgi:hypothetical protein
MPKWLIALAWVGGSIFLGLVLAVGTQVAVVRTHGGKFDPVSLFGGGQLMPGSVASLLGMQLKLVRFGGLRGPAWYIVFFVCMLLAGFGAFWWGVIAGSSQLDAAFVAVVSVGFYLFALLVIGSGAVISES